MKKQKNEQSRISAEITRNLAEKAFLNGKKKEFSNLHLRVIRDNEPRVLAFSTRQSEKPTGKPQGPSQPGQPGTEHPVSKLDQSTPEQQSGPENRPQHLSGDKPKEPGDKPLRPIERKEEEETEYTPDHVSNNDDDLPKEEEAEEKSPLNMKNKEDSSFS